MLQSPSIGLQSIARRSFATLPRARPSSIANANRLQKSFRRGYADAKPTDAVKPRRFRTVRWLWRATYLSAIAGTAYLCYDIYELRHPLEQPIPDPSKQNLVILGESRNSILYARSGSNQLLQVLDGVLYLFSKSSTPKTTMSLSSPLATTSYSHPFFHHAQPEPSSTGRSWNR